MTDKILNNNNFMQIKNTKNLISRIRKRQRERKIVECNQIKVGKL